jgi:probable phosphoglycerate mutase
MWRAARRAAPEFAVRHLFVLRHGETVWNRRGCFQGQADVALSAEGRRQAAAAAAGLAGRSPALVVSSDLRRAAETAAVIAAALGVPLVLDARLREEDLGPWEGLTRAAVAARYPADFARWEAGDLGAIGGREGLADVAARAAAAVAELDLFPAVVVTHVNTARALLATLLGLPWARWPELDSLPPGGWAELVETGDTWTRVPAG